MLADMQDSDSTKFALSPLFSRVVCGVHAVRGASFEPIYIAERTDADSHTLLKEKPKVASPPLYKVMLLNDDYTPMEFVVGILQALFNRSHQEAVAIMLHVHKKGVGICGSYPYDIAETKAAQVVGVARKNEHPLQCVIEKEEE